MPGQRRPHVCLVSPFAWPLFEPSVQRPFGGSEVRASLLARELARLGRFEVSVVVYDYGQGRVERRDGVTLHSRAGERPPALPVPPARWFTRARLASYRQGPLPARVLGAALGAFHGAIRPLRAAVLRRRNAARAAGFIGEYPVLADRLALYDGIAADLYAVLPGGLFESAELAFYCRARGKKFAYLAASDADCDPAFKRKPNRTGAFGVPGYVSLFAIDHADLRIAQTAGQAKTFEAAFGRPAVVVPNPVDAGPLVAARAERSGVLWVGKSSWIKRPEVFLALARSLPDRKFVMVLNPVEGPLHARCLEEARALPNLRLLEHVPYAGIEGLFAEAALFVNTSAFEGFPNTFLQAAKYSVPIVSSSVDPDGMLTRHGCGRVAGDGEGLKQQIAALLDDAEARTETGARAASYVAAHHRLDVVAARLQEAFESVLPRLD